MCFGNTSDIRTITTTNADPAIVYTAGTGLQPYFARNGALGAVNTGLPASGQATIVMYSRNYPITGYLKVSHSGGETITQLVGKWTPGLFSIPVAFHKCVLSSKYKGDAIEIG